MQKLIKLSKKDLDALVVVFELNTLELSSNANFFAWNDLGKRSLRPVTRTQCSFKCSGCKVPRKHKTVPVGTAQKCKTCDNNVSQLIKLADDGMYNKVKRNVFLEIGTEKL